MWKFTNEFGVSEETIKCTSNISYELVSDCDGIIFDAFVIPDNIDLDNITRFQIIIGGLIIFDIPWDIIKINNVKHIDKFFYIKISSEYFGIKFDDKLPIANKFILPLTSLKQNCYCVLRNKCNSEYEYKIMVDKIFYNKELTPLTYITYIINEYEQYDMVGLGSGLESVHHISNCKFIEGFYIKTTVPLVNYKLTSMCDRGYDIIIENKDKNAIAYHENLQEISKSGYIYWFPLNKYKSSSINYFRNIKIILTPGETNGYIFMKKINEVMFQDGLCCLRYSN